MEDAFEDVSWGTLDEDARANLYYYVVDNFHLRKEEAPTVCFDDEADVAHAKALAVAFALPKRRPKAESKATDAGPKRRPKPVDFDDAAEVAHHDADKRLGMKRQKPETLSKAASKATSAASKATPKAAPKATPKAASKAAPTKSKAAPKAKPKSQPSPVAPCPPRCWGTYECCDLPSDHAGPHRCGCDFGPTSATTSTQTTWMITPKETVGSWMYTPKGITKDAETQTEGILIKASTKDVGLRNRFGCVREIDWMVAADRSAD